MRLLLLPIILCFRCDYYSSDGIIIAYNRLKMMAKLKNVTIAYNHLQSPRVIASELAALELAIVRMFAA